MAEEVWPKDYSDLFVRVARTNEAIGIVTTLLRSEDEMTVKERLGIADLLEAMMHLIGSTIERGTQLHEELEKRDREENGD